MVRWVHGHTVVGDLLDCTEDVWVTYNGKKVQPGDTMSHIGVGNHDTLRCGGRLRDRAQRYRPPPVDIPGQWTCQVSWTRTGLACENSLLQVLGVRKVICHLSLIPLLLVSWVVFLKLQPPRTRLTGPSVRIPKPVPPTGTTQKFSSVKPAIAGWSGGRSCDWICSRVPSGKSWVGLLRSCNRS